MTATKNKNFMASLVSYLFVPPVMTVAIFVLVALREHDDFFFVVSNAMIFGFVLPVLVFIYLRKKSLIANDDATIKEERTLPYLIGCGLTLIAMLLNYNHLGLTVSTLLWAIYFLTSLLITVINKFWKISAHTMGVAVPLGTALYLESEFTYVFLFILAVVMWARLKLKVHTPKQVLAGALLGSILSILILSVR